MVKRDVKLISAHEHRVYFPEIYVCTNRQKSGYTSTGDVLYTCDTETLMGNRCYSWYTIKGLKIYQHVYIVAEEEKHVVECTSLFYNDDYMKPFLKKHAELKSIETTIHEVFALYNLGNNKYLEQNKLTF